RSSRPQGEGTPLRIRLLSDSGDPAARLERVSLVENSRGSACLDATFRTANGTEVSGKIRLKRGDVAIQVEPGPKTDWLRAECQGRFGVLPDFFADDITIDATRLPLERVELPSENFFVHLTGEGNAMAVCVFENRREDMRVTLSGSGARRIITGSET